MIDTPQELVDLMIEGAAETDPAKGFLTKDASNKFRTCAYGAAAFALTKRNNKEIDDRLHGDFDEYLDALLQSPVNRRLNDGFIDVHGMKIIDYNDKHGRDKAIKAIKDIL